MWVEFNACKRSWGEGFSIIDSIDIQLVLFFGFNVSRKKLGGFTLDI